MAQETASQAERSANLNYGYHFFEELAPVNLNYIALLNGVAPCPVENFSYCDLGCSNGVSLNVFAASYPQARFFGIDYNPNHISNANKLAKHGKLNNVKFVCKNFIDLDLKSIPKFDYIIINNLVSYLAPNEQDQLLNFIEKKLKIGGLLYISYNTMPGWSHQGTIREMLKSCAEILGGTDMDKLKSGLAYVKLLHDENIGIFNQNEAAKKIFEKLLNKTIPFIMHESLSSYANAYYFNEIVAFFKKIHMRFLGSFPVYLNHKTFAIPKAFSDFFGKTNDREFLETQKDIITNTAFRRDIFLHDRVALLNEDNRESTLEKMYFSHINPRQEKQEDTLIGNQAFTMKGEIYTILQNLFKNDIYNALNLVKTTSLKEKNISQITAAIKILMAFDVITPCKTKKPGKKISRKSKLFIPLFINQNLSDRIDNKGMGVVLASPILGSGVSLTRIMTIILEAYIKANQDIEKTVNIVIDVIKPSLRPGVKIDELRERLLNEVADFQENILPVLIRLDIIREVETS